MQYRQERGAKQDAQAGDRSQMVLGMEDCVEAFDLVVQSMDLLLQESKSLDLVLDLELKQIEEACQTDAKALNWNLVYLEKCGFVELGKSIECPPYIASSATLTAKGIDLIEDQAEFKRLFSEKQPDPAKDPACRP